MTTSVVHTTIGRSPTPLERAERIEARQFFGYVFPVLDEVLTDRQKTKLAEDRRRTNVAGGVATVQVRDVKDLGTVRLHYLVRDDKPLARPTAMVARVRLSAKDIQRDPMVLRKYLAPEGAERITREIRAGQEAGKRLTAVEITKMYLDIVSGRDAGERATFEEFKKDLMRYCGKEELMGKWPARFQHPDGKFDLEMSPTQIFWVVKKLR